LSQFCLQADDINKGKENSEGLELSQGETKPSYLLDGGCDKSEKKTEDVIQCEQGTDTEMSHHDMVRGMLNGIVDTVVQGILLL
jgi:hypothetical protein